MFNAIQGPARERVELEELLRFPQPQALVVDDRRRRPLYFDGRFLRAADLTRDQNYFLTRQADLGRVGGMGVVHGLQVTLVNATQIRIAPGHGVCPSGELVVIEQSAPLNIANIAEIQALDVVFGLMPIPREPARNRSGLYILALRPVEFSANPIASYPTTIQGPRSLQDGDIIEAAAVTLVPYHDEGAVKEANLRRARAAYNIFVRGSNPGMPANALPLAMLSLDHGTIQWIDTFSVRREVGTENGQVRGIGFTNLAVREAHALQYDAHLQDVLKERRQANRGQRFVATEHFLALPAAGRMPSDTIDPADFTQIFFPTEMDVELSLVPSDELPAMLKDSFDLPPIDLTLTGDEMNSTSVLVVIPVPRAKLRATEAVTGTIQRKLLPNAPGLLAKRSPLQALQSWKIARLPGGPKLPGPDPVVAAWRAAVPRGSLIWYIRRRNFAERPKLQGTLRVLAGDEAASDKKLAAAMKDFGLAVRFGRVQQKATSQAQGAIAAFLSSPRFLNSMILTTDAVTAFEAATPLNSATAADVLAAYSDGQYGTGLARLEVLLPDIRKDEAAIKNVVTAKRTRDVDLLISQEPDNAEAAKLAKRLLELAAANRLDELPPTRPTL